MNDETKKILATRADLKRLGIVVSNSTLLRWEAQDCFPRRIRMAGTTVAWLMPEIETWLTERADERANTHYAND